MRWRKLPTMIQQPGDRARIQTQAFLLLNPCSSLLWRETNTKANKFHLRGLFHSRGVSKNRSQGPTPNPRVEISSKSVQVAFYVKSSTDDFGPVGKQHHTDANRLIVELEAWWGRQSGSTRGVPERLARGMTHEQTHKEWIGVCQEDKERKTKEVMRRQAQRCPVLGDFSVAECDTWGWAER